MAVASGVYESTKADYSPLVRLGDRFTGNRSALKVLAPCAPAERAGNVKGSRPARGGNVRAAGKTINQRSERSGKRTGPRTLGIISQSSRALFRCRFELAPDSFVLPSNVSNTPRPIHADPSVFHPSDFISFTSAASSFFIDPAASLSLSFPRSRPSFKNKGEFSRCRTLDTFRAGEPTPHGRDKREKMAGVAPLFRTGVNRIGTFQRVDQ